MLETIVSSKTRIKLLIKFFLFEGTQGYLRSMEKEFNESTNSIRIELRRFMEAGLLISEFKGKRKYYKANVKHPLYEDIRHIVIKTVGIDQILKNTASVIDNLEALFVIGNFATGVQSDIIELAFVGHDVDSHCINKQIQLVEKIIRRKIMHVLFTPSQMEYFFHNKPHLILWKAENYSVYPINHKY
jgi:DNA-binding transcriptional ArsR family regulator